MANVVFLSCAFSCVGMIHLIAGFLKEEIVLYVAIDSLCLQKELRSESPFSAVLNQNVQLIFKMFI